MVTIKLLPQFGQIMLEGSLPDVMECLDMFRWAEATINVYCREDTGGIGANAVCETIPPNILSTLKHL